MASQTKSATPAETPRTEADTEALGRQIETIRKDISDLNDLIAEIGAQRTDDAARKAGEKATRLRAQAEAAGNEVQDRIGALGSRAEAQVREEPAKALLIATGLGLLSGLLLARR